MAEEFLSDRPDSNSLPPSEFQYSRGKREPVRLIMVGSRIGVITMIHTLHLKAVANADEWSDLQPEPMTGKWMGDEIYSAGVELAVGAIASRTITYTHLLLRLNILHFAPQPPNSGGL